MDGTSISTDAPAAASVEEALGFEDGTSSELSDFDEDVIIGDIEPRPLLRRRSSPCVQTGKYEFLCYHGDLMHQTAIRSQSLLRSDVKLPSSRPC